MISQRVLQVVLVVALLLGTGSAWTQESADLNRDRIVNASDQILFLQQWQTGGAYAPDEVEPVEQVEVEIMDVTIPADNRPEVTFTLMNGAGDPIDPADLGTYRFIIAKLIEDDPAAGYTQYMSYNTREVSNEVGDEPPGTVMATQATYDSGRGPSGGVAVNITDNGDGTLTYKFEDEVVIAPGDMGLTHTVSAQIEYDLMGQETVANPIFNFVPDGSAVSTVREFMTIETCNACHTDLGFHGGGRKEIGLCILCHNPAEGNIDPDSGNSIDMAEMIHKIHMGANLPLSATDPYIIYGFRNSEHDYSDVHYPQDIRNCESCHTGSEANPDQADAWNMYPSRRACGSCHEDVNFETGEGHSGGNIPQTSDAACTACHGPDDIMENHTPPRKKEDFPLLMSQITEVANTAPGATPTVTFNLTEDIAGVVSDVSPGTLDRVAVTIAGPTVGDYNMVWTETIGGNVTDNLDGTYTYMLGQAIPDDAMGTWAFGLEARGESLEDFEGEEPSLVANPVEYAAVTDAAPVPRREVVDFNKCNMCHDELRIHGSLRVSYEYCLLCHNPSGTDIPYRDLAHMNDPSVSPDPVTINFKDMVHKIHRGTDLENPYSVVGFRAFTVYDYHEIVHFPGMLNECEICHLPDTYGIPTPEGTLNTIVENATGEVISNVPPQSSSCLSCHDGDDAMAHANSFVALEGGMENCAECHGKGAQWSYERVHVSE